MNRRELLKRGGLAAVAPGLLLAAGRAKTEEKPAPRLDEKRKRVGCTSVCFRMRFPQTRPRNAAARGPDLKLLDVPALFAEKLGVHNVEVWSPHFAQTTEKYCKQLRAAAEKAGSKIINIQLDGIRYNLSAPDAAERKRSLAVVREWMGRAAACGAGSLRANTGGGRGQKFDVAVTGDSFRRLAEHGKKIGVKILIENHGGHSSRPENVVAIIKAVDSPFCRTLPDFGNMPGRLTQAQRNEFLGKLLPYAHLISAKGMYFDEKLRHSPYDLGACVRFCEKSGYKGIYSAEQWAPKPLPIDTLTAARRIIELIVKNL